MLALNKILTDYTHYLAHPFPKEANPNHILPVLYQVKFVIHHISEVGILTNQTSEPSWTI